MEIASGTRYGMLTVIGMERRERDCRPMWRCLCDCGRETLASGNQLESGDKKSCGCLGRSLRVDTSHLRAGLEAFRAARREERTRRVFGLPQRTGLRVIRLPRYVAYQRYHLRKLGYIVPRGGFTAYYTPETRRSPLYEDRPRDSRRYVHFEFRNISEMP